MDGAAQVAGQVGVQVGERGVFLAGLVVGERVIHDGVLGDIEQGDVLAHVLQVGPVVLAQDEELAGVAEDGGPDAGLLEAGILLDNRDVPAHIPQVPEG